MGLDGVSWPQGQNNVGLTYTIYWYRGCLRLLPISRDRNKFCTGLSFPYDKDKILLLMTFLLYVKFAGCKQMGKQQKVLSRLHLLNSCFKAKIVLWIKNFWNQWYGCLPTPCRLFFEPHAGKTVMFQAIKTQNTPFFSSLQSLSPGVCTPWSRTGMGCLCFHHTLMLHLSLSIDCAGSKVTSTLCAGTKKDKKDKQYCY